MGPIQLRIDQQSNKLYEAWEASRKSELEDFKDLK